MRLHHVAYTTKNLDKKVGEMTRLLGFKTSGGVVFDPVQKVRIQFVESPDGSLLELMEPAAEDSPITGHLNKGGGLYHMCFEVDDLEATLTGLRESGEAFVVCEPVAAPAIGDRRVAFVVTSGRDVVEFVEAARNG